MSARFQPPVGDINWFLNRELHNHDYVKEYTEEELDRQLDLLDPKPQFHVPLLKRQKAMFLLGVQYPSFLFLADIGAGKTSLTLNLIKYFQLAGRIKHALVLVPNLVLIQGWQDECEIHTPDLKMISVHGTTAERLKQLNTPADFYVLNYPGLQPILSKTTGKRTIYPADVIALAKRFEFIAYDQITAVKNISSLTYKICSKLSENIKYRYGLTGRPFGRHIEDLWAQFYCVDLGETLGRNFYYWRSAFFKATKKPWAVEWKFRADQMDALYTLIKNRSIRYHRDEFGNNIPVTRVVERVSFPPESDAYFKTANNDLVQNLRNRVFDKAKSSFIKMRQISSGFLNFKDEEDETNRIYFEENPKLDLLISKILELPEDAKAIIFYDYTPSGKMICEALKKEKIDFRWVYGDTPDKEKLSNLRDFKYIPDVKILVMNSASGSMGLNLQHASFMFFFESPVNPITRDECEGRIYRPGQLKHVWIFDLIVMNSMDEKVLLFLKEGKNLLEELIDKPDEMAEQWSI